MKHYKRLLWLLMCFISILPNLAQTTKISGSLKKWHKLAVTLDLPANVFYETHSTFANNRMDVLFTDPAGNVIRVPGFFVADGNAANTGASTGSKFRAYLRPNATGTWTYKVLFYKGTNVATADVSALPNPSYTLSGTIGSITASNKIAPDLRHKGRLTYQHNGSAKEKRYLRFSETGEYFLKLGPDSPENLLNYSDFDFADTRKTCGVCSWHSYAPHIKDFKTGNPTWRGGKGAGIIGALNYLKDQKVSAISMSLYGGDDLNVFPWTKSNSKTIYDISKLEQWEIMMDHAEENGFLLHLKLAEHENWNLLSSTQLKIYYREMVARFGHHLAVEWNISEEYGGSAVSSIERIDWLSAIDPWQNHRVIHTYPGEHNKYEDWLRMDAKLTGASIQSPDTNRYEDVFNSKAGILYWIDKSKSYDSQWVVSSDEQNSGITGVFTSSSISNTTVVDEARTKVLWKTLIAGGSGVLWYGGSQGDFRTENFDRFATLFKWSRYAIQDFFTANGIAFWKSENRDDLVGGTAHCLAEVGKSYVVYMEDGGGTTLNLSGSSSTFNVRWFDPRNGGGLQNGSLTQVKGGSTVYLGNPPNATTSDWVALVSTDNIQTALNLCEADFEEKNKRVVIEAENLDISGTSWVKRTEKSGSTGNGYISWEGSNHYASPGNDILSATIKINNPGKYRFQWRNTFGKGSNTTEHNDSWLRFADASDFYAERGTSKVYPAGSGKTPNPKAGAGSKGFFKVWLSGSGSWSWYSRTWDFNSHYIYVEFDSPGVYTMEISGRSSYHLIDRIVLYQEGVDAHSLSLQENSCSSASNPTLSNTAPSVSITSPSASQSFVEGNLLTIRADALDRDGYITRVEFYYDGNKIGEDSNAPYILTTTAKKIGNHVITAKAYDNKGATTTSPGITIKVVTETNAAPRVSLTAPANGQKYEVGDTISYSASASDTDGYIIRVEFYVNGAKVGEDSNAPYSLKTTAKYLGDYAITAKAIDNKYKSTVSSARTVSIVPSITGGKPSVNMVAPANGQKYNIGEVMNFSADASDSDGYITRVEFYSNGSKIGEDSRSPYYCRPIMARYTGKYSITAKAIDNKGNYTWSSPIQTEIVATKTNHYPVVHITTPKTAIFSGIRERVTIVAAAGDADGRITKVEFYAKGVIKLGTDTTYPFSTTFYPIIEDRYPITAVATDNSGNVSVSSPLVINVLGDEPAASVSYNTVSLLPIHDAYLDYNTRYNHSILRVQNDRRRIYFKFDLSSISGDITKANLKLKVNSDAGSGLLYLYKGSSDNWTETNLSLTNRPDLGKLIGTKKDTYNIGDQVDISLNIAEIKGDFLTLVMTQISGNDVAFGAKESSASKPRLELSYEKSALAKSATAYQGSREIEEIEEVDQPEFVMYPNPAIDSVHIEGAQLEGGSIELYTVSGILVQNHSATSEQLQLDVSELPAGVYLLFSTLPNGSTHTRSLVIQK